MKVIATQRGYRDGLIEPGEEFNIPDEPLNEITGLPAAFSESWMKPVEPVKPVEPKKK